MLRSFLVLVISAVTSMTLRAADLSDAGKPLNPLPKDARLMLDEDWSSGKIDPDRWYVPRRKWGAGNNGVTPDNVRIARDTLNNREQNVLVCQANGDLYDGPVVGFAGKTKRVGGIIVSRSFFASGRIEAVMKIGSATPHDGGPPDPSHPIGTVPAIWTYAYRYVAVPKAQMNDFVRETPLYNPLMRVYGGAVNEYWSELDFPEFGKAQRFDRPMYNTFCQNRHEPRTFEVNNAADGQYHTFTTEWRTKLEPLPGISDTQVIEHNGFYWVQDKAIPFQKYFGNPLKRLDKDRYAVYIGDRADHWIDGKKVAENTKFVPSMAAQLTLGVWLPDWAGEAPWKTATVSFASAKVWQYDDPGDVRGVLTENVPDNFEKDGRAKK
jgi:hypothetical protein